MPPPAAAGSPTASTRDSMTQDQKEEGARRTFSEAIIVELEDLAKAQKADEAVKESAASQENAEWNAGFLSRLIFAYITPLLSKASKRLLQPNDIGGVYPGDATETVHNDFEREWQVEVKRWKAQEAQRRVKEAERRAKNPQLAATVGAAGATQNGKPADSQTDSSKQQSGGDSNGSSNGSGKPAGAGGKGKGKPPASAKESLPSAVSVLYRSVASDWYLSVIAYLIYSASTFGPPLLLNVLVKHIQGSHVIEERFAYLAALGVLVIPLIGSLAYSWHDQYINHVGFRAKSAVAHAVYRKSLRLSASGRGNTSVGNIVNIMSNDAQQLQMATTFLNGIWASPLQIGVAIYLLYDQVGAATFVGLGMMVLLFPVNGMVFRTAAVLRRELVKRSDVRVKWTNEILVGMRVIKMYAWEQAFKRRIFTIREAEMDLIKRMAYTVSIGFIFVLGAVPLIMPVLVFITYSKVTGDPLDAARAFTTLALFNLIRMPFAFLPLLLQQAVMAQISLQRVSRFLLLDELQTQETQLTPAIKLLMPAPADPDTPQQPASSSSPAPAKPALAPDVEGSNGHGNGAAPAAPAAAVAIAVAPSTGGTGGEGTVAAMLDRDAIVQEVEAEQVAVDVVNASFSYSIIKNMDAFAPTFGGPGGHGHGGGGGGGHGHGGGGRGGPPAGAGRPPSAGPGPGMPPRGPSAAALNKPGGGGDGELFSLSDLNIRIKRGQLCAIVGPIGSGKSSLLTALLGELKMDKGRVVTCGTIAYAAQQPWIFNASLRDNILFDPSVPMDEKRYKKTIDACALHQDLTELKDGDMTEIGERGINLSGGQKARISLARAVYSSADIVMMDDPLSAVDPHVGEHLFKYALQGMLAGRTRVLVTNQLQFLSHVDHVVVMDKGRVAEQGTFEQLMTNNNLFAQLIRRHGMQQSAEDMKDDMRPESESLTLVQKKRSQSDAVKPPGKPTAAGGAMARVGGYTTKAEADRLIQEEERATGDVASSAYAYYLLAAGPFLVLAMLCALGAAQGVSTASDFWLARWADATRSAGIRRQAVDNQFYINIYAIYGCIGVLMMMSRAVMTAATRVNASKVLHNRVFDRVIRAPMVFFETTPIGRILNRFSRDVDSVDRELGPAIAQALGTMFLVFGALIAMAITTKGFFLIGVPVLAVLYYYIQHFFRHTSTEVRRLESISRSPIFAHFSETLSGTTTIRAYGATQRYMKDSSRLQDENTRISFMYYTVSNWLSVRLDLIGSLIGFTMAIIALTRGDDIPAGWAGLALTNAFAMTGFLKQGVRMTAETESRMNAVERLRYYDETTPQEPPAVVDEYRPPANWPTQGHVVIRNLSLCYKPGVPVLKSVSLDIRSGEKIGIAGRTGSGKTTLMVAMLRLVEAEAGSEMFIDDVDLRRLGLDDVRHGISIIPQDPVLFSDTVAHNLDPFDEHSEEELWEALEMAQLREHVDSLPGKLKFEVAVGGENFSVGQRQMICMARALLRRPKVLFLDEATASIDLESDHRVQRMIRAHFKNVTVLTIAHRLQTIMDSDRILVLDNGNVREFDTPRALLDRPQSALSSMVASHGAQYAETLRRIGRGEVQLVDVVGQLHELQQQEAPEGM